MIKKYITLPDDVQTAVKSLTALCEVYDGSIVPIQFDHSLNFYPQMHSWFLCFEEEELLGVLSIFNHRSDVAEISGCVHPGMRNKGIFNELIAAGSNELALHSIPTMLFVVDNKSAPGMAAVEQARLQCDHIEYLMAHTGNTGKYKSASKVRAAGPDDVDDFININSALFHETEEESRNMILSCLQSGDRKQYMAEMGNEIIGICTLYYSGNKATIYGLGVSEKHQGKGLGFELINSILDVLKQQDCEVELEVDSKNEKAYNLYKKVGFKETRVVNYYIGRK
ncbi:GNAT family N-acetyltransferase [Flavipsychrobacter stenotrophus]|nr:GNAT family N-acetyltransferase [Flavipsychrobacter stenotrophus]